MKHRSLILVALCLGLMAAVPTQAKADSCDPLLDDFYAKLGGGLRSIQGNKPTWAIPFLHTTNYDTGANWFTAHSWGFLEMISQPKSSRESLASGAPRIRGTAHRTGDISYWGAAPGSEIVDIIFYRAGSWVVYFGPYGPYTPTCYDNKFLVVNTGDSYETLSFVAFPLVP